MQVRNWGLRTSEEVMVIDSVQTAGGTRESSDMIETGNYSQRRGTNG